MTFVSLDIPITIGTVPFDDDTSATVNQSLTRTNPSAPTLEYDIRPLEHRPMNPSAPLFPDDDTVSIRTYCSTPPPFPDDGSCIYLYSDQTWL